MAVNEPALYIIGYFSVKGKSNDKPYQLQVWAVTPGKPGDVTAKDPVGSWKSQYSKAKSLLTSLFKAANEQKQISLLIPNFKAAKAVFPVKRDFDRVALEIHGRKEDAAVLNPLTTSATVAAATELKDGKGVVTLTLGDGFKDIG